MDNIFNLFKCVAANHAAIALETATEKTTYHELLTLASHYANQLAGLNDARLGIEIKHLSAHHIAMMLAAFATKKSFLLLDGQQSLANQQQLIADSACTLVIDDAALTDFAANLEVSPFGARPFEALALTVCNSVYVDEGYVITSSGTTGAAKIILGSHAGLAHFLLWQKSTFFQPSDRVAHLTNCRFDVFFREVFTPLLSGACLIIPETDLKYASGATFYAWLEAHQINTLHLVPSVTNQWLAHLKPKEHRHALKNVFFAGEKLHKTTVQKMSHFFEVAQFVNLYGPSETTLAKFYYPFTLAQLDAYDSIPVGRPLPNTTFVLQNTGEVWIKTAYRSLGYLSHTPFIEHAGEATFPTGDLGHQHADLLFLNGRIDDQVKVNGIRIHLNDIQALCLTYLDITEAAIVQTDNGKLIGFYVGCASAQALLGYLQQNLPATIVVQQMQAIETLPKTPSGKVNRQQLLAWANALPNTSVNTSDAMQNEPPLASIWRQISPYEGRITPESNVFALGGDSLDMVSFAIALSEFSGKTIDYWDIYHAPTFGELANCLENKSVTNLSVAANLVEENASVYPLSPQQRRYKNIYMPERNTNACNMIAVWAMDKIYTPTQIQAALRKIVARHDSLQSFYQQQQMHLVQALESQHLAIETVFCSATDFQEHVENRRRQTAQSLIDIETWPLFRCCIVTSPMQQSLIWGTHHLICDGYSQQIILKEWQHYLQNTTELPAPSVYRTYAQHAQAARAESVAYWRSVYQTPYQQKRLPVAYPEFDDEGSESLFALGAEFSQQIRLAAKQAEVTPFTLILAAYFLSLHELNLSDDIVVGTPALGRKTPSEEQMVGNFISLVTIRSTVSGLRPTLNLAGIKKVHHSLFLAMKHQDHQYDTLVLDQGYEFSQATFPLTSYFISLMHKGQQENNPPNTIEHRRMGNAVKFDQMLYVDAYRNQFILRYQYRLSLFSNADQTQFFERHRTHLQQLIQMIDKHRTQQGEL